MKNSKLFGNAAGTNANMPAVNPLDYPSEVCPNCGCEVFIPGIIFKKVPGMLIGQGSETTQVPLKVFICANCRELSPYDKKLFESRKNMKDKNDKQEEKKLNLIV